MANSNVNVKPEPQALLDVIEASPFTMTPERQLELVGKGARYWGVYRYCIGVTEEEPDAEDTYFISRGVGINLIPSVQTNGRLEADIHFVPQSDSGEYHAKPNLKHGLRFMLDGITGAQDYCLLVEAGYFPAPEVLVSATNPRLALLARRFGFRDDVEAPYYGLETIDKEVDIVGTYEDFKAAALGVVMARRSEALAARLNRATATLK